MSLQQIADQLARLQLQFNELRAEAQPPAIAEARPRAQEPLPAIAEARQEPQDDDADSIEADQIEESLNRWLRHTLAPAIKRLVEDQVGKHKTFLRKLTQYGLARRALNDARINRACDRLIAAISDE